MYLCSDFRKVFDSIFTKTENYMNQDMKDATVIISPGLTAGPHLAHGQSAAPGGLAAAEKVMVTVAWGEEC